MNKEKQQIKKELTRAIQKVVDNYRAMDAAWVHALGVFDGSPENPLYRATWGVFDDYLGVINTLCNIEEGWLHWFIYENDCGEKEMEAGFSENLRTIVDVESFVDMLLEVT